MTNSQHPACEHWAVTNNMLTVGGIPVPRLVSRVDGAPCYIYDRGKIRSRIAELRGALPTELKLNYAVKANPMPAVVQLLAGLVDGFDVASAGEMLVALDTGKAPENISFAGPGKTDRELAQAVAAEITVHVESDGELRRLAQIGQMSGQRPRVALRVNPNFQLKASGMRMGGGPQQFGIDAEKIPDVLQSVRELDLEFIGFHIFAGSQNLDALQLIDTFGQILQLAERLADQAPAPIAHLNVGGGFGIPYFPKDQTLDLARIGEGYSEILSKRPDCLTDASIIIELGRYMVGEAGLYVSRVIDRKSSREEVFLVTDGGLNHHLAVSGNFGQTIRRNYPIIIANRVKSENTEIASIVGPLCTPLDMIADRMELPVAEVGDLVAVLQSGAYGPSASPASFLSHPPAKEILV